MMAQQPEGMAPSGDGAALSPTFARLLDRLADVHGHELRGYAPRSLARRLELAARRLRLGTLEGLERALQQHPAETLAALLPLLPVSVSDVFRDPDYFRALRDHVVPHLRTQPWPKVWVAGCGRGQEAFSIAVLLREAGLLGRSTIYATDIDERALAEARSGRLRLADLGGAVDRHRRSGAPEHSRLDGQGRWSEGEIVWDAALLARIVFATHNLVTDAVFAEVHLVSCRNVLIYFDRPLQDRAIGLFRASLARGGFIGLGNQETLLLGAHAGAFEALPGHDEGVRLFRVHGGPAHHPRAQP